MNKKQRTIKTINNKRNLWFSVFCFLFFVFYLLLPSFSFIPRPNLVWGLAQNQSISPPATLEEARGIGERIIHGTIGALPKILERIWKEEVLPVWRGMYNWAKKNFWDPYLQPFLQKIQKIFKKEVEKRKEIIKEEFPKEKKELKKEIKEEIIPKTIPTLWQKFKELIK